MLQLPKAAEPLASSLSIAFTRPTWQRAILLLVGAILARGRRTVTGVLRTVRPVAQGHFSDYHRVLSRAPWSTRPLAHALAAAVLELLADRNEPVVLAVDDTDTQHRGDRVYAKGRHRDACRSTRAHTVWLWGHRWVVLAVLVRFPFAARPWALPVLVGLYKPKALNESEGRAHRTPIAVARLLVSTLLRWFPDRRFILLGDGGYASHGLAAFCHARRRRLTLVSLLHPRAHLCELPPPRPAGKVGRDRVRGDKLPHPQDAVKAAAKRTRTTVDWYGDGRQRIEYVTGTGQWYKAAEGLVPVRWVFVHPCGRDGDGDDGGTRADRYLYSTDPRLSPARIVGLYTARWAVEVTFQEAKQRLGLGRERSWCEASVCRTAPCLLGLFSVVSLWYHRQAGTRPARLATDPWYADKAAPTFSDALAAVRRSLWDQTIFSGAFGHGALKQLKPKFRETLLDELSRAA